MDTLTPKPLRRKSRTKPKTTEAPKKTLHLTPISYIFTFLFITIALITYDLTTSIDKLSNFENLKTELLEKVYNQTDAISSIFKAIESFQTEERIVKVVNFIGSNGVGKTFTANIIRNYFPLVYEQRGSVNLDCNLISDNYLLIFDDLTVDNLNDALKIPKMCDLKLLIIFIFNIQETDDFLNYTINYNNLDLIVSRFNESEINYEIARFNEFTIDKVEHWIKNQLSMKGVTIDNQLITSLLTNQNVKYHGLKGLTTKINLEL